MGHKTNFGYDSKENLTSIKDAFNNQTMFTYTANGLLESVKDAKQNSTTFTYDTAGNLTQTTDPLSNVTKYSYDSQGNVTQVTDAEGLITKFGYSGTKLASVTDALNKTTTYAYDANKNLRTIKDAKLNTTKFEYNSMNLLKKITDPLLNTQTFVTDSAGRVTQSTNARGQVITYSYDAAGRLIQKTTPDNVVYYGYDAADNLTSVRDNDSKVTFVYDLSGRVTSTTTYCQGNSVNCQPKVTLSYTYDGDGNRLSVADDYYDAKEKTSYSYNSLHAVTSIRHNSKYGWQSTFELTYDSLGRRTFLNYGPLRATYGYNKASFLASMTTKKYNGSTVEKFNYTYDKVGNRVAIENIDAMHTYYYDFLYRLSSVTHPLDYYIASEFYNYDAVGNQTQSQLSNYTYNAGNELVSDAVFDYTYDADGNLVQKTERVGTLPTEIQYAYDAENQLVGIQTSTGRIVTFGYDGLGRRIWKEADGFTTRYIYDDEDILMQFEGLSGSWTYAARYIHGPGIDEPLTMMRGINNYYYVYDGLGSVTDVVNGNGIVVNHYDYDSFGNFLYKDENVRSAYTFTGREYDEDTGLYYYRARYYDAAIGRFIQKHFSGPQVRDSNVYTYSYNNPVNEKDVIGLDSDPVKVIKGLVEVIEKHQSKIKEAMEKKINLEYIEKWEKDINRAAKNIRKAAKRAVREWKGPVEENIERYLRRLITSEEMLKSIRIIRMPAFIFVDPCASEEGKKLFPFACGCPAGTWQ